MVFTLLLILATVLARLAELPRWEFESESELHQRGPNSHLFNIVMQDGIFRAETTDWDPLLLCRSVTIGTKSYQYVVLRLKADRPGIGEVFWLGELEGQYGGLAEKKQVRFSVKGEDLWRETTVFPFWHTEGVIGQRCHFGVSLTKYSPASYLTRRQRAPNRLRERPSRNSSYL